MGPLWSDNLRTHARVGMGFDAIWISPMVTNTPNGYHGYWLKDLYGFNPNFGTESDLKALIQDCHSRNMFIMLDVVCNHVGQVDMCVRDSKSLVCAVAHATLQGLRPNCPFQQSDRLSRQVSNHRFQQCHDGRALQAGQSAGQFNFLPFEY